MTGLTYAKYEYRPDYLYDDKKGTEIYKQKDAYGELQLLLHRHECVFDGGNYVRCGNKVIMTDRFSWRTPTDLWMNYFSI